MGDKNQGTKQARKRYCKTANCIARQRPSYISPGALDNRLRSERVEMDVKNQDATLLPGMVAEVLIPLKSKNTPFVVPKTAAINTGEGTFVITVVNKKAKRIKVETGLEVNEQMEIYSNELNDDLLITKANEEIREGSVVN